MKFSYNPDIIKNYNSFDLESLLIKELDKNKEKITKKNPTPKRNTLLAVVRDLQNRVMQVNSDNNRFQSERNIDYSGVPIMFGPGWLPDRVMEDVPLYVSDEQVKARKSSEDYQALPKSLTDLLSQGILRTSGNRRTDYSVLMSVTEHNEGKPPEGRTGVLLHKGKPVVVNIDGKEFVVEVKGVGCPDGNNGRIEQMNRTDYFGQGSEEYGGFDLEEAKREFGNLEIQRKRKTRTFADANGVRVAGLVSYLTSKTYRNGETKKVEQGYLIRLAPSNIRSSFNSNPNFPHIEDRETLLATSVGKQYAELAKLRECLLHSTIHPENILWTGSTYVLTDFADCRKLNQIKDPHDFLNRVLKKIKEVPGLTERGVNLFYSTIATELGVDWDAQKGYDGFIDALWGGHFAERVYQSRKGKRTTAKRKIDGAKNYIAEYRSKDEEPLSHLFITSAKGFLEKEVDLLQHIDAPEAKRSVRVAKKRIAYLDTQLDSQVDINRRFKRNPNSYYGLYVLPYMKS
ncbi:MAG: hypothetical protein Q8N99_04070 [Nanoarchaeota archaeon]|nr:hypothetical protein [Nanoarchaeota archaeon]